MIDRPNSGRDGTSQTGYSGTTSNGTEHSRSVVEPIPELADLYDEGFEFYLENVNAARGLWDRAPQAHGATA